MRHLDLFSGIGTWALASREVWPDRELIGFCEIDPYCREVLAKHFPEVKVYEDVRTLSASSLANAQRVRVERRGGPGIVAGAAGEEHQEALQRERDGNTSSNSDSNAYELDLFTASPPCQAASSAGKRKGTSDDRWLWPETFRILSETRPRWFVFENVRGLLSLSGGLEFDDLISQMESHNYEVWPVVIPASGVGAPHRRERVWFIGRRQADAEDAFSVGSGGRREDGRQILGRETAEVQAPRPDSEAREGDVADPASLVGEREFRAGKDAWESQASAGDGNRLAPRSDWSRDWRTVARELCWEDATVASVRGVDDGPPQWVYGSRKLSEAAHRRERLKALGNGIVPQVAVEIMKAIKHADSLRSK